MGLRSISLRVWGNVPSGKDVFMIEMARSVMIGLAAFMSQAGQGSREVALFYICTSKKDNTLHVKEINIAKMQVK